jgi:hypothetical protein
MGPTAGGPGTPTKGTVEQIEIADFPTGEKHLLELTASGKAVAATIVQHKQRTDSTRQAVRCC